MAATPPPSPARFAQLLYDDYARVTQEYKSKYGDDTVVLMEVGGFLEFYDCDRNLGADVPRICALLNVQATRKSKSVPEVSRTNPAMGGIPRIAMSKYVPLLVDAGFSVVLYMQQAKQADDASKNLPRAVTEVISASTVDVTASLDLPHPIHSHPNPHPTAPKTMLAACIETGVDFAIVGWAIVDLSTGRTSAGEVAATSADPLRPLDALRRAASDACPVESIVEIDCVGTRAWSIDYVCAYVGLARRTVFLADPKKRPGRAAQNALFARAFPAMGMHAPAEYCDLERKPRAFDALSMAIRFLADHNEAIVATIQRPRAAPIEDDADGADGAEDANATMDMSADAVRQLDVWCPEASSQRQRVTQAASLLGLLNGCKTPSGRRAFRDRLIAPSRSASTIAGRLDAIEAMLAADDEAFRAIRSDLERVGDLERAFRRVSLGRLSATDLLALAEQLDAAARALRGGASAFRTGATGAAGATGATGAEEAPESACVRARNLIVSRLEAGASARDSCFVRGADASIDEAQDELDKARWTFYQVAAALNASINAKTDHVVVVVVGGSEASGMHLAITATRWKAAVASGAVERTVIEPWFRGSEATLGGEGSSASSAQRIVHRAVDAEASARVGRAQATLNARVAEGLRVLMSDLSTCHTDGVWSSVRAIEDLDVALTGAANARAHRLVRPVFSKEDGSGCLGSLGSLGSRVFFRAKALRHPIVEALLERRSPGTHPIPYVPNDVSLGCDGCDGMLLYGVNSVGKSSIMKAVGIAVILAQAGMFVPAASLEIGPRPFTGIFTRIGLRDDIARGQSTFQVEMRELRAILRRAGPASLVIGDELCAGTESPSALAIVGAGVRSLAKRGTPFVFATHLHELVSLPHVSDLPNVRAMHLSVRFEGIRDGLVFDRRLTPGTGPPTYGLEVCRSLDMDPEFMRDAEAIREHVLSSAAAAPKVSRYNRRMLVHRCAVCEGAAEETHHIEPQATPEAERTGRMNRRANLVALCGECHDRVHRGELSIDGYVATSNGSRLSFRQ